MHYHIDRRTTMPTTTNYQNAVMLTTKTTSNGGCTVSTGKLVTNGSVTVTKNLRQSRPKPDNLLLKSSMTPLPLQSVTRAWNGKRTIRTTGASLCLGVPITWVQVVESAVPASYMPKLKWPSIDWPQAVRLKVASQQVNFAENIGEYRETLKQLEGVGNVLKRAGFTARRLWRNRKSRKKFTRQVRRELEKAGQSFKPKTPFEWRDAVGTHLAITFGVTPMISQLEDVLTELDRVKQRTIKVQVTMSRDAKEVQKTFGGMTGSAIVNGVLTQRALVYVRFQANHGSFTAGNLASSIWAGTRLSFMVDWAVNVGSYLESLTALSGVEEVWGTVTTKYASRLVSTAVPAGSILVEPHTVNYRAHDRQLVTHIPLPKRVEVQIPDWNIGKFVSSLEIFSTFRGR
jgi:hypothetical protein